MTHGIDEARHCSKKVSITQKEDDYMTRGIVPTFQSNKASPVSISCIHMQHLFDAALEMQQHKDRKENES
jgi:hypothetical protein